MAKKSKTQDAQSDIALASEESPNEIDLLGGENIEPQGKYEKIIFHDTKYLDEVNMFYRQLLDNNEETNNPPPSLDTPLEFYKNLLSLSQNSAPLNKYINIFLNEAQPTTESRKGVNISYWDFCETLLGGEINVMSTELKYMLRFGMPVTSAVNPTIFQIIKKIDVNTSPTSTIYYLDEWLQGVSQGKINQSTLDETVASGDSQLVAQENKLSILEKQQEEQIKQAEKIDTNLNNAIDEIIESVSMLKTRENTEFDFDAPFNQTQDISMKLIKDNLNKIQQINDSLKLKLSTILTTKNVITKTAQDVELLREEQGGGDNDIFNFFEKDEKLSKKKKKKKKGKIEKIEQQETRFNTKITSEELTVLRQMMKMLVGKSGNHFPVLYKEYFSGPVSNLGIRKQAITLLSEIEKIDFSIFRKSIRGITQRIFPIIALLPCYGNNGICWEPFERLNRNTSAAKIAVPMYSKNLYNAILRALGDFRWQHAKEYSGYLWMEEGLTGYYFQWFDETIKKGDVKEQFIADYITWMKWESNGQQKLDQEVRKIFWRFIPFNYEMRLSLAGRTSLYADLMEKEKNRALI